MLILLCNDDAQRVKKAKATGAMLETELRIYTCAVNEAVSVEGVSGHDAWRRDMRRRSANMTEFRHLGLEEAQRGVQVV